MTEAGWSVCAECGMGCNADEYHPYAACLMFKQCRNSETVRANLQGVRDDSYQQGRVAGLNLACIAVSQFSSDGEPIDANELRIALVQLLGELAKQ